MDQKLVDEMCNSMLFKHKGMYFQKLLTTPEIIDSVEQMEIRDSDVFLVTFPKSGTVWTLQILCQIYKESHGDVAKDVNDMNMVSWVEYNQNKIDVDSCPSPRLFSSHLPYYLVPKDLRNRKGKVIYVFRNPKDNLVSFYHFRKLIVSLQHLALSWESFFDLYMSGKVYAGLWFDHVRGWYTHKEDLNCLFFSYEEMIKDLRSAVLKICQFVDIKLDDQAVNRIVDKATFNNMKQDPLANYKFLPNDIIDQSKGEFLRKGTIGDWKNKMTVAQNEKIDEMLKEKLRDLPIKFVWDINEEIEF
ncbi:amine sulfotransferase-like [Mixophyes fleayi]|uniref:amine sulfotransferase-like n=1 Tax=Mixophyes fleayi TaxID=3061075 RepID=UPI003F4DE27A